MLRSVGLVIFIFGLTFALCGQDRTPLGDPNSFLDRVEKAAQTTRTLKSAFRQEKSLSFLDKPLVASGRFFFRREDNVRWEYEKPFPYLILLTEGKVILQDEGKASTFDVAENPLFSQINDLILLLVNGNLPPPADFDRSYFQTDGQFILLLKPKTDNLREFIQEIELSFNKDNMTVDRVLMTEPNSDFTRIDFFDKEVNPELEEKIFSLD